MKTWKALLAGILTVTMFGCSSKPAEEPAETPEESAETAPEETPAVTPAASEPTYTDGLYEGYLGTVMPTAWFDFTVTNAKLAKEYEGHEAPDGYDILIVDMDLKNTFGHSVPMFYNDFQAQWFDDADDAYAFPFSMKFGGETIDEDGEYALGINENAKAVYAFEVPAGNKDFSISMQEYYEDESYGDLFFVYFTVK
ncbi:MAG: hypothetical protein IKF51_06090 [Solobacterium sp.]|nr:hypothetical protein [Solobacterium sp.]